MEECLGPMNKQALSFLKADARLAEVISRIGPSA